MNTTEKLAIEADIEELFDDSMQHERQVLRDAIKAYKDGDAHQMMLSKHSITMTFLYNQRITIRQINVAAKVTDLL